MGSVFQFPIQSVPALTRPTKLGNPVLSLQEIACRHSVSSIRAADGSQIRSSNNSSYVRAPNGGEGADNSESRPISSSSKKEILALFNRIITSLSKEGNSQPPEEAPTAEVLMEVLRNSRKQKEEDSGKKPDKMLLPRNESLETEPLEDMKTRRTPSNFSRKSPIPTASSRYEFESESKALEENREQESKKFEDMKLAELKEVAKSKGMKGYSKLKKSELVELLISS